MAKIYGEESEYIREIKQNNFKSLIILFLVYIVASGIYFYAATRDTENLLLALWLAITFLVVIKILINLLESKGQVFIAAKRGLDSEDDIAGELAKLPDTYSIFRGFRFGKQGDVDFIVVGPAGVFAVEAKSHRGKIGFRDKGLTLRGAPFKEKNILRQAFGEAMTVHDYLFGKTGKEIFVTPIIVFSSRFASLRFGLRKMENVHVVGMKWLLELISKSPLAQPEKISAAEKALREHFEQSN